MDKSLIPNQSNNIPLSDIPESSGATQNPPESSASPLRILDIIRETTTPKTSAEVAAPPTEPIAPPATPIRSAPQTPLIPPISFAETTTPKPPQEAATEAVSVSTAAEEAALSPRAPNTTPATPFLPSELPEAPIYTGGLQIGAPAGNVPVPEATNMVTPKPSAEPGATPSDVTPASEETASVAKKEFLIPSVHTLRDDMKNIVQGQNMSMVRATALEQVKRQSRTKSAGAGNESTPTMKKRSSISRLLFFTILLLVLAALLTAGFFAYRAYSEQGIPKEANLPSIIFAEQTVPLSLERTTPAILRASLGNARAALSSAAGSMVRIVPTVSTTTNGKMETRAATGREFLNALGVQVPLELSGSLGEEFFLGLQTGDSNPPVLIFTLTSYERAFAGMLAWEKTLSDSLVPLFTRVPVTVAAPDGSIAGNSFADVVIKNFDVRVLTDPGDANNAILYSFPNRGLLIITVNPYTLTEVLSRLQAARKL